MDKLCQTSFKRTEKYYIINCNLINGTAERQKFGGHFSCRTTLQL